MRRLKGQISEMKGLVDKLLMEGVDSLITGSLTSGKEEVRVLLSKNDAVINLLSLLSTWFIAGR